jgi:hypothetical protein
MVWLSSKDISLTSPSRKLAPRQLGPYKIVERTGELTYRLALPPFMRQHPVFHIDRLSRWGGNEVHGRDPPPPEPIVIKDDLEYEVEAIYDSRKYRNQLQYLVKWKGYDAGHNSWEPAANLAHSAELVEAFHVAHPAAPRRLAASVFADLPWQKRFTFTTSQTSGRDVKNADSATGDGGHKEGVM